VKNFFVTIFLFFVGTTLGSLNEYGDVKKGRLFTQLQSGYAWMRPTNIRGTTIKNGWEHANDGYEEPLNNHAFWDIGIGVNAISFLDIIVSYGMHETMYYEKYQVGLQDKRRMRFFELDHRNVIFSLSIHPPKDSAVVHTAYVDVVPFVGGGIGAGFHSLTNFYTVEYRQAMVGEHPFGMGSATMLGDRQRKSSFAWQFNAGLTFASLYRHVSCDIGYRYYNGGTFKTSAQFMSNNELDKGAYRSAAPWCGLVRSHQVEFTFRINF
jgi:hypothetical protein